VENGTKPTLTASDMGKSSKNRAVAGSGTRRARLRMFFSAAIGIRQEHLPDHYDLSAAALPSAAVAAEPHNTKY